MNNAAKFLGIVAAVAFGIFIALFAYQEFRSHQFENQEAQRQAAEAADVIERLNTIKAAKEFLHELIADGNTLEITILDEGLSGAEWSPSTQQVITQRMVTGDYSRADETDTHRFRIEVDSDQKLVRTIITDDDSDFLEKAEADPRITAVY